MRLFGWFRKKKHECNGKVIRCVPHDEVFPAGLFDRSGQTITRRGTNLLLKCECGRWWIQWAPGVWTPSDFDGMSINVDKVLRELSEEASDE